MKVFGIAGFKNAGKTTLVVELVQELTGRGLTLATLKHAHHDFDIDQPGKDSMLHRQAGAREVIVASDQRWAHIRELGQDPEPSVKELLGHLSDVDLVLIEGWKRGSHPRLEVRRSDSDAPVLAKEQHNIVAVVSDAPMDGISVPVINPADVPAIADLVLEFAEAV